MLMLDQLKRRGRALANRCFLCEEYEETINHLLVHYKKARMLWDLLSFKLFSLGNEPQRVKNVKSFGWQPRCVYFGPCGKRGIGWCLKIGLPWIRGQKLSS